MKGSVYLYDSTFIYKCRTEYVPPIFGLGLAAVSIFSGVRLCARWIDLGAGRTGLGCVL